MEDSRIHLLDIRGSEKKKKRRRERKDRMMRGTGGESGKSRTAWRKHGLHPPLSSHPVRSEDQKGEREKGPSAHNTGVADAFSAQMLVGGVIREPDESLLDGAG